MRPTLKKLEVKDIGDLERLVAENIEGIEPGLKVIDSRLLLGQAAIDLVGLDAKGSLVLIALDFAADEALLLRVMDAYSWCLEYPDTIHRLYPMAQVTTNRPPRILFIVERLSDSFVRRIKALSFLEIDCLEFRHLEVDGASALYFDLVQRLRRADAAANESAAESEPQAPQWREAHIPLVTRAAAPVVEPERPAVTETPVIRHAARVNVQPPVPAPEPVAAPPEVEPALSFEARFAQIVEEPVSTVEEAPPEVTAAVVEAAHEVESLTPMVVAANYAEWGTFLSQLGVETPTPLSPVLDEPPAEPTMAAEIDEEPAPASAAPVPPPARTKPAEASVTPSTGRTYFFAKAGKDTMPAEASAGAPAAAKIQAPAAAAPPAPKAPVAPAAATVRAAPARKAPAAPVAPAPAAASAPAPAPAPKPQPATAVEVDRPELESLNFPKDGLSRQWLEFLNQLSAAK